MKHLYFKALLFCLCLFAGLNAIAYDAKIDGIYYNFPTDSTATVTYQSVQSSGSWPADITYYISDYSGVVVIPESVAYNGRTYSVTSIGGCAFYGCTELTSVTIPNSVTSIGSSAFHGCTSLTTITIPESVTSIGGGAFYETPWYDNLPDGVVYIGKVAYEYKGTMPEGVQIVIAIKEGTTIIADYAFSGCTAITSVTIPNSVTSIGSYAFSGCTAITSVTIPNSVTSIGEYAFEECTGLTSVTIPNSVTSIGERVFYGCTGLTSVIIGNGVTSIGSYAFYECTDLTSVTIGNGVTSIGSCAFRYCSSLTTVNIPNGVTSIDYCAFEDCSSLISIIIPESVTNIGYEAFRGCKLRNVLVKSITPPILDEKEGEDRPETFSNSTCHHATLYVPTGTWDDYAFSNGWFWFNNIRETALEEGQVSTKQAYTLMDAGTFAYSVYDPVNDCIGTINSAGNINEDNPNHSWQMIEAGGAHYLYNLGAKKYVKRNGNTYELTNSPEPIDVEDGENGLILGAQTAQQWALVSNEHLNVAQSAIDEVTGINDLNADDSNSPIYNLSGQRLSKMQKGINIRNGKKILVK